MEDDKNIFYSKKSKQDLLDIVRLSKIMPVSKANKMKKQELIDFLISIDKKIEEDSQKENDNTNPKSNESLNDDNNLNNGKNKLIKADLKLDNQEENPNKSSKKSTSKSIANTQSSSNKQNKTSQKLKSNSKKTGQRKKNTIDLSLAESINSSNAKLDNVVSKQEKTATISNIEDSLASSKDQSFNNISKDSNETKEAKQTEEKNKLKSKSKSNKKNNSNKTQKKVNNKSNKEASKDKSNKEESQSAFDDEENSTQDQTIEEKTIQNENIEASKDENIDYVKVSPRKSKFAKDNKKNKNLKNQQAEVGNENYSKESNNKDTQNSDNLDEKEIKEVVEKTPPEVVSGILEVLPDGFGFLRRENYLQSPNDIYVQPQIIRKLQLRAGDEIKGEVKRQRENDKYQALSQVLTVNNLSVEDIKDRPHFGRLTPVYPNQRFKIETNQRELAGRIIDLVSPIGKGQRAMIVSPPKAGKTILLQKIANAISQNNPEAKLIVLLIDERPEEVTDMQRSIKGEVAYSTFDKMQENHVKITELVLERAKRLVELGQDVVILLDSMTRLARAYNLSITPTGRTLSGGLDPGALYGPKRFFGAARKIENGGSLTIIATSLIETGSRMDEVIFEEFKGTGNMEVILDRKMAEKRIFPAIDIVKSGTRREDLLLNKQELEAIWSVRKTFSSMEAINVTEVMNNLLLKTKNNDFFISTVNMSLGEKNILNAFKFLPNSRNEHHDRKDLNTNVDNSLQNN